MERLDRYEQTTQHCTESETRQGEKRKEAALNTALDHHSFTLHEASVATQKFSRQFVRGTWKPRHLRKDALLWSLEEIIHLYYLESSDAEHEV
jgi:hypothetical protein